MVEARRGASTCCDERLRLGIEAAKRRRTNSEATLAGALCVIAPHSSDLFDDMMHALDYLVDKAHSDPRQLDRPLFVTGLMTATARDSERCAGLLQRALLYTQSVHIARCAIGQRGKQLAVPLQQLAANARPAAAFCAELARISRDEADGRRLAQCATRMKESDRVTLVRALSNLDANVEMPKKAWAGLRILRDAERSIGRWYTIAKLAGPAGYKNSLEVARKKAAEAGRATRVSWQLAAWGLDAERSQLPAKIPSLEVMRRLTCDRRTDHDPELVFRLAEQDTEYARTRLLELCRSNDPTTQVRAHVYLSRAGDGGASRWLEQNAAGRAPARLRALCVGGLYDLTQRRWEGDWQRLSSTQALEPIVWLGLVELAERGAVRQVLQEGHVRRIAAASEQTL